MYRRLIVLLLAFVPGLANAAPVKPIVPCGVQVYAFGGPTILAEGVKARGSTDFAARMETFFGRVCLGDVTFEMIAEKTGRLIYDPSAISDRLARSPRSVALIHFPASDIDEDISVERLLQAYKRVLDACAASGSICIIGGQQPVNSFTQEMTDLQLELERRASAAFGPNYLPLYRYFQSESSARRLMTAMDSGNGRFVGDYGHELLYQLYRRRLIELTSNQR